MKYGVVGICSLLLAGCATSMSEDECLTANWKAIGFQDGIDGRPITKLGQRTEQCGKFGVLPDQSLYLEGRVQGLGTYCQPGFGLNVGKSGRRYENVCPPETEPQFLAAYDLGREFYQVNRAFENAIEDYDRNVESVRRKISDYNRKVDEFNKTTDPEKRAKLSKQLEQLKKDIDYLKSRQFDLQLRIDRTERALRAFMYDYPQRERALLERFDQQTTEP